MFSIMHLSAYEVESLLEITLTSAPSSTLFRTLNDDAVVRGGRDFILNALLLQIRIRKFLRIEISSDVVFVDGFQQFVDAK